MCQKLCYTHVNIKTVIKLITIVIYNRTIQGTNTCDSEIPCIYQNTERTYGINFTILIHSVLRKLPYYISKTSNSFGYNSNKITDQYTSICIEGNLS